MKWYFWSMILIFCTWSLFFIGKGADSIDIMSERYKRALDAGANAAAAYRSYNTGAILLNQGTGYGTGLEHNRNVLMDKDEALKWFYRLFFANLSISDKDMQKELKSYIPMKAIICYDRLMIADAWDNWSSYYPSGEKEYIISYLGKPYKFTLADQIYDVDDDTWLTAGDIGLTSEERKYIITQYIIGELNSFLDKRQNKESGSYYKLAFSLDDAVDDKLSGINGVNFLVFCEGIPIPSLNPFKKRHFYAYGVGGGELRR